MLVGADRRLLLGFPGRVAAARQVLDSPSPEPHQVAEALEQLAGEELLLVMAGEGEEGHAWVRRYLTELRGFELAVRGADLVAAGVKPGPAIGRALEETRRARLDGRIGPGEELGYALSAAGESGTPA